MQLWEVVGGSGTGGLLVRSGESTASEQLQTRLGTSSLVRQLDLKSERLHYELVEGSGPERGWISTKIKGKDLAVRSSKSATSGGKERSDGSEKSGGVGSAGSGAWNPYDLLGVSYDATEGTIRSAFRKTSLKVHPDRAPDNADAAAQFRALKDAKDFLLNPAKRRLYNLRHGFVKKSVISQWWSTWAQIFEEIDADPELQEGYTPSPMPKGDDSRTDLLIFGATGLVGTLACSVMHRMPGRTWAVAGRCTEKLDSIADKFKDNAFFKGAHQLRQSEVELVKLVRSARVVVDFTGPKFEVGYGTAEACARTGVHYIEISGDPKNTLAAGEVQSKLDDIARKSGAALIFFCGTYATHEDLGTWHLVKHMRETYNLETWKVDSYAHRTCPVPGTYMYEWYKRPLMSEICKVHGGPFVLGGQRSCGVREEDRFDPEVTFDEVSGMWRSRNSDGFLEWVVRRSCGLHDDIQPYGADFLIRDWGWSGRKKDLEDHQVTEVFVRMNMDTYVAEGKMPPRGNGPRERTRRDSIETNIFHATAVDDAGAERHAYGILTSGPGGSGDMCEGSAICSLEAAQCLLDELDAKQGVRAGFGTPAYHLAHLGYLERLVGHGYSWKVADGMPPKELFANISSDVKSLSA